MDGSILDCNLDNDDAAVIATVFEMGGFPDLRCLDLSSRFSFHF